MSARSRAVVDISQRLLPFQQAITMPTHKTYCVYIHAYKGQVFYVGKGLKDRPFQVVGRHPCWHEFVNQIQAYEVSIVLWTDNESLAYAEEARLIERLQPLANRLAGRRHPKRDAATIPHLLYLPQQLYDWLRDLAASEFRLLNSQIVHLLKKSHARGQR